MKPAEPILEEMQTLSPRLAVSLRQALPYRAPAGYFDTLPLLLLARVTASDATTSKAPAEEISELSPLLAGISRKMPFATPTGYFSQPPVSAPGLLDGLSKEVPYAVPDNYFESFPDTVRRRLDTDRPARIFILGNWKKYAAVAAVTTLVAVGGWFYQQQSPKTIAPASEQPVLSLQVQQELEQLGDDAFFDLSDDMQPGDVSASDLANNSNDDLDVNDIHLLLQDVSDKALQDFLGESPQRAGKATN